MMMKRANATWWTPEHHRHESLQRYGVVDIPLGHWNHRVEFVSDRLLKLQRRELARDETVLVAHKATMQHAEPYNHRWVDESCHNYRIG
jgi:hypothetical protein